MLLAATVQYESARESATQMGMHDLPPEPFTMKQQHQTRMDGGEDEDGSLREYVPIAPAVVQPHIEREHDRAAAENRIPLTGSAQYRDLALTGAFQSTFPWYRQRFAFASLGGATQPTVGYLPYRSDAELFSLGEDGKVLAVLKPDGTDADQEALEKDAVAWASHFGYDSFNNHCTNHEHNCTETCVKYVKQKLEAKLSLRSNKVPSCRFWYFRVKKLKLKRVRRRGKPLVSSPHVEETDDRNQQFRCQLIRGNPLRSTSNDVCQVTDRCNVDYQFLGCAPVHCSDENDAPQLVPKDAVPQRKRLTKKTKDITKRSASTYRKQRGMKWLYGCDTSKFNAKLLLSFSAAFRKAYAMDFYITKYQGKMMESLTPLFQTMASGIHRLEQQEKEEAEKSRLALEAGSPEEDGQAKKRKTQTEEAARARRVCVRLASMANRCYWLSTTEITTHILTGGDALQSHYNVRVFTRQLQWAMQQCKRILNKEAPIEDVTQSQQSLSVARVQLRAPDDDQGGAPQPADRTPDDDQSGAAQPAPVDVEGDAEVTEMDTCTTSTNAADDYTHRGARLQTMPFYVYRMYVRRVPKRSGSKAAAPRLFEFEEHYPLAGHYAQEAMLHQMNVPTIDGFQCPTWEQDPEQNSLLKSLLFTPWECRDPMSCGNCSRFKHMLSNNTCSDASSHGHSASQPVDTSGYKHTFERAWRLRCSEIHVLAARADSRCHASRKKLVLADTTLFATLKEPQRSIQEGDEIKTFLDRYTCRLLRRTMPLQATRAILAFSGSLCSWHEEQCTVAEFCAYIAQDVISHIELAAEARTKKKPETIAADAVDEDADSDMEAKKKPTIDLVDIGGGADDDVDEFAEDVGADEVSAYPMYDHRAAIHIALQQGPLQSSRSKTRLSKADKDLQNLDQAYGPMLRQTFALPDGPSGDLPGIHFKDKFGDMLALQRQSIALAKRQINGGDITIDDCGDSWQPSGASQPAQEDTDVAIVPLPLAMQGPAAVAWHLIEDAGCTEEQIDAVSLVALSLQKRFVTRPDKTTHFLPVATPDNNHRAVWLGGGGVGKTRTLNKVVEPLGVTFFGANGYAAAAQANHAAQNLGPRGRTLHSSNGLLMTDSLQTARLRLNPQTQKKMDRLAGETGIDVIDELGCVSGSLLHADALRKTYGRSLRFNLETTLYMKPQETCGRMAAKLLCGDTSPSQRFALSTHHQAIV